MFYASQLTPGTEIHFDLQSPACLLCPSIWPRHARSNVQDDALLVQDGPNPYVKFSQPALYVIAQGKSKANAHGRSIVNWISIC